VVNRGGQADQGDESGYVGNSIRVVLMKHEYTSPSGVSSIVYLEDCMEVMKQYPDKYFDLAVVDPPYGIGISNNPVRQMHKKKQWDMNIPEIKYFTELFRVSINQIIWGGNYFDLPASQGFLIWDKKQPEDFSLAMCEMAWMSFKKPAKMWTRSVLKEKDKIHPTQKPIALYDWIFQKYAKEGDKILDTHLGSQSSRISANKAGLDFTGCETDPDYFKEGNERFKKDASQFRLFATAPKQEVKQSNLF
jgi:site-specific DNA-methyltransferase (adenine-specific)